MSDPIESERTWLQFFCFDAFSSRESASTSLENVLEHVLEKLPPFPTFGDIGYIRCLIDDMLQLIEVALILNHSVLSARVIRIRASLGKD
jgi:hypothetical protein